MDPTSTRHRRQVLLLTPRLVALLGTSQTSDISTAFDPAWTLMTAAGLTRPLASLTLGRARVDRPAATSVPPAPTGRSG